MRLQFDTDDAGFTTHRPRQGLGLVVELRYDSGVTCAKNRFVGSESAGKQAAQLNAVLGHCRDARPHLHLPVSSESRGQRAAAPVRELSVLKPRERAGYAHAGFYRLIPKRGREAQVLRALKQASATWSVVPVPEVALAGSVVRADAGVSSGRNMEPVQGYLHAAPTGVGAPGSWELPGGQGDGVTVCDIEANWNRSHEDLPRGIPLLGGRVLDDDHWRQHGTASLGMLVAVPKQRGVVGVCPQASAVVHSAHYGDGFNAARAIVSALEHLSAGDILLLEIQAKGPGGRYVAMQHWDDVASAIRSATERGVSVVEPAGNGGRNLDGQAYRTGGLARDVGAIIVGAGIPPTNYFDGQREYAEIGRPGDRMPFTNWGSMVDLRGWGWHVASLGYGDAGGGQRTNYTYRFSGTSASAALVAGCAACVQGAAKKAHNGPLTPNELRALLKKHATASPKEALIGGLPDLPATLRALSS